MELSGWKIEDQPLDYQVRYWKTRADFMERSLVAERKRKAPATLTEVEEALAQAKETIAFLRQSEQVWKDVSTKGWGRVDALEREGAGPLLRRERDQWRERWRTATRRIGHLLEHQGNIELLEDQLGMVRQRESLLTLMGYDKDCPNT